MLDWFRENWVGIIGTLLGAYGVWQNRNKGGPKDPPDDGDDDQ